MHAHTQQTINITGPLGVAGYTCNSSIPRHLSRKITAQVIQQFNKALSQKKNFFLSAKEVDQCKSPGLNPSIRKEVQVLNIWGFLSSFPPIPYLLQPPSTVGFLQFSNTAHFFLSQKIHRCCFYLPTCFCTIPVVGLR